MNSNNNRSLKKQQKNQLKKLLQSLTILRIFLLEQEQRKISLMNCQLAVARNSK